MANKTNKLKVKSVLFVCTGNTCRSPMAEWIMREKANERGLELVVESRGISASSTSHGKRFLEITADSARAVRELYPDSQVWTHSPRQLTAKDVSKFDLILTMEEGQRKDIVSELNEFCPDLKNKVFAVKEYAGLDDGKSDVDIGDPHGGGGYYQSTYYGGSAMHDDDFDDGQEDAREFATGGRKHSSVFPESRKKESKVGKDYLKVREQLVKCIDIILDGKELSYDEIVKRRKARSKSSDSSFSRGSSSDKWSGKSEAKERQSAAVENRELYGDALDVLNDAPNGAKVEVPWIVKDGLDGSLSKHEQSYLGKKAKQLKNIVAEKGLTVVGTVRKVSYVLDEEPISVRRDPGVGSSDVGSSDVISPKKVTMYRQACEVLCKAKNGAEVAVPYDIWDVLNDKVPAPNHHLISLKVTEMKTHIALKNLRLQEYSGSETKEFPTETPGKRGNVRGLAKRTGEQDEGVLTEKDRQLVAPLHEAFSAINRAKKDDELEVPYVVYMVLSERNDSSRHPSIYDLVEDMKKKVSEKSLGVKQYDGKETRVYGNGKMTNPPTWRGSPGRGQGP